MAFYDLSKQERAALYISIQQEIHADLNAGSDAALLRYFSDEDTYIRKAAYLAIGRIYQADRPLRGALLRQLTVLLEHSNAKVRQTAVNAAGEIGIMDFDLVRHIMDKGLFDEHHSVRNAVIGSMKKMGEKNPRPVMEFARGYLHHEDKEIRREICHGIELRGRTHPQDILPLLRELQWDKTRRVRSTLVHVLGQIAYKKSCLATVVADLKTWENQSLVAEALEEIIDVHHRYKNFSAMTQAEARNYIQQHFFSK
jgi:HEAT repeats